MTGFLFALAATFASLAAAQHPGPRNELLGSPDWMNFSKVIAANYFAEVDVADLERHCGEPLPPAEAVAGDTDLDKCLRSAANSLGLTTDYYSASQTAAMKAEAARRFIGIGLELTQLSPYVKIVAAIKGSPAERADLRSGDLIAAVNGQSVSGLPLADAVRLMRGEQGTDLTLLVLRGNPATPLTFVVTRAEIKSVSVRVKLVAPQMGYLRISQFRDSTRSELIGAVMQLQAASGAPLNKLVLDVRDCPGGLLDAAVAISSLFVPPDTVVFRTVGRALETTQAYRASARPTNEKQISQMAEPAGWPLSTARILVLANDRTAGGAEALAELLRERRQAPILGERTFGFGVIQRILPLEGGASIRLPSAKMLSSTGRAWDGSGLEPDVAVAARREGAVWEFGDTDRDNQLIAAIKELQKRY